MDLSRLRTGDRVIGVSGLALVLLAYVPWFAGEHAGLFEATAGGLANPCSALAILIGLALLVVVVLRATDVRLPDLGVPWDRVLLVAAAGAAALVLIQVLVGGGDATFAGFTAELEPRIGLYLGVAASLGLVVGAALNVREGLRGPGPPPP